MDNLTEMYSHKGDGNPVRVVEDVYGKWVPRRPSYPTLDGLSFKEWNARHSKKDEPTEPIPIENLELPWKNETRGTFVIRNLCGICNVVTKSMFCVSHGDRYLKPVMVQK